MSDVNTLFLARLASPGWQHPGFAPYWPVLRRLRRLAGLPEGGPDGGAGDGKRAAGGRPPGDGTLAGVEGVPLDELAGWETACWVDMFNVLARWRGLRSAHGLPLRFVAGSDEGALDYEQRILRHGEIPCKLHGAGARHDFHNGLVWLRFPRLKACFNLLHCQEAGAGRALQNVAGSDTGAGTDGHASMPPVKQGRKGRGPRRDALTLLDENGALWPAPLPIWVDALRQRHWQALFVGQRQALQAGWPPVLIGHGLLEKLHRPYKSMTAKLLPCPWGWHGLDRAAAGLLQALAADDSLRPAVLLPLPVQGWPGWDAANVDPAFYDDSQVFRGLPARFTSAAGR